MKTPGQIPTDPDQKAPMNHQDLDFRSTETWGDFAGIPSTTLMFGDSEVGPFAFMSATAPRPDMMPTGFSHAHASDNWRISVRGTTDMGRDSYAQGQFRFHDGGKPYAGDNLAWGPDGGFGLILFGDRRGFAIQPVKESIAEKVLPSQVEAAERLGIDMLDECPGAPAINTSIGTTQRAHLDGGFDQTDEWPELAPGVRVFVGLFGERNRGPVITLIDAAPDTVALGPRTLDTETLIVPVSGSITANNDVLEQGCVRLEAAGAEHPALLAGHEGVQLIAIVGDRSALRKALADGDFGSDDIAVAMSAHLDDLADGLAA